MSILSSDGDIFLPLPASISNLYAQIFIIEAWYILFIRREYRRKPSTCCASCKYFPVGSGDNDMKISAQENYSPHVPGKKKDKVVIMFHSWIFIYLFYGLARTKKKTGFSHWLWRRKTKAMNTDILTSVYVHWEVTYWIINLPHWVILLFMHVKIIEEKQHKILLLLNISPYKYSNQILYYNYFRLVIYLEKIINKAWKKI